MSGLVDKLRYAVDRKKALHEGIVYRIDENTVAKLYTDPKNAIWEYSMGKILFEQGVQVPEFYEMRVVDPIARTWLHKEQETAVFMQYIKGRKITKVRKKEKKGAVKQYKREISKVLDMGIHPFDANWAGNTIYSAGKLYLIDFASWENNPAPERLEQWREKISKSFIVFEDFEKGWLGGIRNRNVIMKG